MNPAAHGSASVLVLFLPLLFIPCSALDALEYLFGPRLGRQPRQELLKSVQVSPAEELVRGYGYPFEEHEIVSESGYILSLHRIPYGAQKKAKRPTKRPAMLFLHGFLAATDCWLFRGPKYDLPYTLADAGYDVWMGNMRGNIYSRRHKRLNANFDKEYWDFSLQEIAYYDLPTSIDYILNVTRQEDLFFSGHSLGSTLGLMLGSLRPEYNSKIRLHLALAPLVFIRHPLSLAHKIIFSSGMPLSKVVMSNRIYNVFPRSHLYTKAMEMLCNNGQPFHKLCINIVFLLVGEDLDQFNITDIPRMVKYYPAGTSIFILQQVIQIYLTGEITPYDYEQKAMNLIKYKKFIPEPYNLTLVTHPVSLHYGPNDYLVTKEDIDAVAEVLRNPVGKFEVPSKNFNHMDFIWANNAKNVLYDKLIVIMEKYR